MVTLIPAVAVALAILLLAAIISILIQFEGGINPKDDNKRRIVFWVFAILGSLEIGFWQDFPMPLIKLFRIEWCNQNSPTFPSSTGANGFNYPPLL